MQVSRRAALVAGASVLAVCGCTQNAQGQFVLDPAIEDVLQKTVATACGFVPAVATLLAVAAASFPALNGVSSISASVLSQFSSLLCSAYKAQLAESGRLRATPKVGSVEIHGLHIVNGQFVAF